jgi:hypothetical protein
MEAWRAETMYSSDTDFIFPSIKLGGRQPRTGGILVTDYIHPAAVLANILGWSRGAGVGFALRDLPPGVATPVIGLGRRASPPSGC